MVTIYALLDNRPFAQRIRVAIFSKSGKRGAPFFPSAASHVCCFMLPPVLGAQNQRQVNRPIVAAPSFVGKVPMRDDCRVHVRRVGEVCCVITKRGAAEQLQADLLVERARVRLALDDPRQQRTGGGRANTALGQVTVPGDERRRCLPARAAHRAIDPALPAAGGTQATTAPSAAAHQSAGPFRGVSARSPQIGCAAPPRS